MKKYKTRLFMPTKRYVGKEFSHELINSWHSSEEGKRNEL